MKIKNYLNYILTIITIIILNTFSVAYSQNTDELYQKIDLFSEVLEKIQNEYVEEIDQAEAMDSAINGLLQSLDPYSSYMSPKTFEESEVETSGKFGGLGIEVSMESGVVKVIAPIDDTPAARAGVKAGDYITKINGEQVRGKTLMEAVNLMRGPVGTSIEITIRRKSLKKAKIINITREIIEIKSVVAKLIDDKVGYLRLRAFNENSSNQLKEEISEIEKNKKLIGYILDLRNNPGGLLTQAIEISNFFLDEGEIVSTKGRKNRENRKFFAKKGDQIRGKPLLVLINNGSASASEIVAGALQDHKRAIILGEQSYGKGSVQTIFPLKDSSAIKMTTALYFTPSGDSIHEIGITPDIEVEFIYEDESQEEAKDNQLEYALNLLSNEIEKD